MGQALLCLFFAKRVSAQKIGGLQNSRGYRLSLWLIVRSG